MLKDYGQKEGIEFQLSLFQAVEPMKFHLSGREVLLDLLLLDVAIDGEDGFSVVQSLREKGFAGEVIFLTNDENQWERAFDIHAFHYIVEPNCKRERFEWIIGSAVERLNKRRRETIALTCAGERRVIALQDILYFEVRERWVTVYYGDEKFEFFARLSKIEHTLLGRGFMRVHRSYLVALDTIASIAYNTVTLRNGTEIPLARGKYSEIQEELRKM